MSKSNVSVKTLLKLKSVFEDLEWNTKDDDTFERFSETLEFLTYEQQELLFELTRNFLRIDIAKYHFYLRKTLTKIDRSTLNDVESVYVVPLVAKKDIGKSKSSMMVARFLTGRELRAKDILGVKSVVLVDRFSNMKLPASNNCLFFLVDDFVGTGETADGALDEFLQDSGIDKSKILLISIVSQQIGYNRITEKGIQFVCAEIRKRGISDECAPGVRENYIKTMTSIEDLIKVKSEYRLGYMGSEALVTLDRTPNNTFPVYWLEKRVQGKKFTAPFPRD